MNESAQLEIGALLQEILKRVSLDQEYLTIEEVAARLKCNKKTILNRMAEGIFREGLHYFRPAGVKASGKHAGDKWSCEPLFRWSAVVAWVEGKEQKPEKVGVIPMRKGYST